MTEAALMLIHNSILERQSKFWSKVKKKKYLETRTHVSQLPGMQWWRVIYTLHRLGFEIKRVGVPYVKRKKEE